MDIINLQVPAGIRFISDWDGYDLRNFAYPHILNKTITGCGYTEYCLRNSIDTILCSPRRLLLQNKEAQHLGEVFYFRNEHETILDYEKDVNKETSATPGKKRFDTKVVDSEKETISTAFDPEDDGQGDLLELKRELIKYWEDCHSNPLKPMPCKILVTYDSFRHVKEALIKKLGKEQFYNRVQVVVDEFQSILIDSRFKATTEIELLGQLSGIQRLCFVSATPMLNSCLEKLDEFKDLPYYQLDWETLDPGRVEKPKIEIKEIKPKSSPEAEATTVIQSYLDGRFVSSWRWIETPEGKPLRNQIVSNEAVLYFNSVASIARLIKKNRLFPYQCNVLCANTKANQKKIREAFNYVIRERNNHLQPGESKMNIVSSKDSCLGEIPKYGEPHKMFTFCTRTVYLGADFYSTCARSFIFSDANVDCLNVDISMDLEQILGRQRLRENPWKNWARVYIKTSLKNMTKEDFDAILAKKQHDTNELIESFDKTPKVSLAEVYEREAQRENYKHNYVSVNRHAGGTTLVPVYNKLVQVAEERAFEVQQIDYKDRFSVFSAISSDTNVEVSNNDESLQGYIDYYNGPGSFHIKFREFCENLPLSDDIKVQLAGQLKDEDYKNFFIMLGPKRCKALKYQKDLIKKELDRLVVEQSIEDLLRISVLDQFKVGKRYLKSEIKEVLRIIYTNLNYQKTPKASDLEIWFNIKSCVQKNKNTGKKESWFEIVSIKI